MKQKIYTFFLSLDWKIINELSIIDRFGGSWTAIEKREYNSLNHLKSIATVRSVGASTRIEGSKMTDDEVEVLIKNIAITPLEERDRQEVAGYFETLDIIAESYNEIDITESNVKHLHNRMLKYSKKDTWHKGNYKQQSNVVEATNADGSRYVVFQTSTPGFATDDAMRGLFEWYNSDKETHPIVRSALFVYDFLSIHPFQDGNGRLSRLLATLLLLREGYSWIQYVSFEHEIESRKSEYYNVLMQCQRQRPGEEIFSWVMFFLNCLNNIQKQLMSKLEIQGNVARLSTREKAIYVFVESHPGSKSGNIATKLDIPLPTVKRTLTDIVRRGLLMKHGKGSGTNYTIQNVQIEDQDGTKTGKTEHPLKNELDNLNLLLNQLTVEPAQTKITPEVTQNISHSIFYTTRNKIMDLIKIDLVPKFENYEYTFWVDSTVFHSPEDAEKQLEKNNFRCGELGLQLRLNGFKPAGTEAFYCDQRLFVQLHDYKYTVGFIDYKLTSMGEYLYHKLPKTKDLDNYATELVRRLVDDITMKIQRIKNNSK